MSCKHATNQVKPIILTHLPHHKLRMWAPSQKLCQKSDLSKVTEYICIFKAIVDVAIETLQHKGGTVKCFNLLVTDFRH